MSDHNPLDSQGQKRAEAEKQKRDLLQRESEREDWKWLMSNRRGRHVVWRLLDQAGVFRSSFNPNALQMAFAEGQRNYGNEALAQITTHCSDQFLVMLKEHSSADRDRRHKPKD